MLVRSPVSKHYWSGQNHFDIYHNNIFDDGKSYTLKSQQGAGTHPPLYIDPPSVCGDTERNLRLFGLNPVNFVLHRDGG